MDHQTESNGSGGAQATLSNEEFSRRLASLVERWRSHNKDGLVVRHETGKLLNDRLGPPTKRHSRGEEAVVAVSKQLHVAESELSRMRRFAHHFDSVEAMTETYPEATTWTAVKALLPKLKPKGNRPKDRTKGGAASSRTPRPTKSVPFGRMKRLLESLSSKLKGARKGLSESEKKRLLKRFKEFAEAVSKCLDIEVSVNEVSAEKALQAAPKE